MRGTPFQNRRFDSIHLTCKCGLSSSCASSGDKNSQPIRRSIMPTCRTASSATLTLPYTQRTTAAGSTRRLTEEGGGHEWWWLQSGSTRGARASSGSCIAMLHASPSTQRTLRHQTSLQANYSPASPNTNSTAGYIAATHTLPGDGEPSSHPGTTRYSSYI